MSFYFLWGAISFSFQDQEVSVLLAKPIKYQDLCELWLRYLPASLIHTSFPWAVIATTARMGNINGLPAIGASSPNHPCHAELEN